MDTYTLLVDLHKEGYRQGPGGDAETEQALALAGVDRTAPLQVADIGCGTGASTLVLARLLPQARITAVDLFADFLDVLRGRAAEAGVADRITTLAGGMEDLPFAPESLDVMWSEGAIYNMGFANGIAAWRPLLKPGGVLVVSEITWATESRPAELQGHWDQEYPEVDVASAKMRVLEQGGYAPVGYFLLPVHCWLEGYYRPMLARFETFLERHGQYPEAREIVAAERYEIDLYERHKEYVSYGMYIARKVCVG